MKQIICLAIAVVVMTACTKKRELSFGDGTQQHIYNIQELKDARMSVTLSGDKQGFKDDLALNAHNETDRFNVGEIDGEGKFRVMFDQLALRGKRGDRLDVRYEIDKNFVTAYRHMSAGEKEALSQIDQQIAEPADGGYKVALFKYPVQAFGKMVPIKNQDGEETSNARIKPTTIDNAEVVQVNFSAPNRKLVEVDVDSAETVFLRNAIDGKLMSYGDLKNLMQIDLQKSEDYLKSKQKYFTQNLTLSANKKFYTKIDGEDLRIYEIRDINEMHEQERENLKNLRKMGVQTASFDDCPAEVLKQTGKTAENCVMFMAGTQGLSFRKAKLAETEVGAGGPKSNRITFEAARPGDATLVQIGKNTTVGARYDSGLDYRNLLKVASTEGKEYYLRSTITNVASVKRARNGSTSVVNIVKFDFSEDEVKIIPADPTFKPYINSSLKGDDRKESPVMSFSVKKYVQLIDVDADGNKLATPRMVETRNYNAPNVYAVLDWDKNNLQNTPYQKFWQSCFDRVRTERVRSVTPVLRDGKLVSLTTTIAKTATASDIRCIAEGNQLIKNGNKVDEAVEYDEVFSLKEYEAPGKDFRTVNIPRRVQKLLGAGLIDVQFKSPKNAGNVANRKGETETRPIIHDFSDGKRIKYVLVIDPNHFWYERTIRATKKTFADLNRGFQQAMHGTHLQRDEAADENGPYFDLVLPGEPGSDIPLGDLRAHHIVVDAVRSVGGTIGVYYHSGDPRTGKIVGGDVYAFTGLLKNGAYRFNKTQESYKKVRSRFGRPALKEHKDGSFFSKHHILKTKIAQMAKGATEKSLQMLDRTGLSSLANSIFASDSKRAKSDRGEYASVIDEYSKLVRNETRITNKFLANASLANLYNKYELFDLSAEDVALNPRISGLFDTALTIGNGNLKRNRGFSHLAAGEYSEQAVRNMIAKRKENLAKIGISMTDSLGSVDLNGGFKANDTPIGLDKEKLSNYAGNRTCNFKMFSEDGLSFAPKALMNVAEMNDVQLNWTKEEVYENAVKVVMLHEMLHAVGLHHNWYGTYDRQNWKFPEHLVETESDREFNSFRNYSSIMDYSGFETIYAGMGPYDVHAVRLAYTGMMESEGNREKLFHVSQILKSTGKKYWTEVDDALELRGDKVPQFHRYMYCETRLDMLLDPACEVFDRGSSPTEIVMNLIESHRRAYERMNIRDFSETGQEEFGAGFWLYHKRATMARFRKIRSFLDDYFWYAIRSRFGQNEMLKPLFEEYRAAALMGLEFFKQVIRTPDANGHWVLDNEFDKRMRTEKDLPVISVDEKTGKETQATRNLLVETRWQMDQIFGEQADRQFKVIGTYYDKIFASQMLTNRTLGLQRYQLRNFGDANSTLGFFSYVDFEQLEQLRASGQQAQNGQKQMPSILGLMEETLLDRVLPIVYDEATKAPFVDSRAAYKVDVHNTQRLVTMIAGVVDLNNMIFSSEANDFSKEFAILMHREAPTDGKPYVKIKEHYYYPQFEGTIAERLIRTSQVFDKVFGTNHPNPQVTKARHISTMLFVAETSHNIPAMEKIIVEVAEKYGLKLTPAVIAQAQMFGVSPLQVMFGGEFAKTNPDVLAEKHELVWFDINRAAQAIEKQEKISPLVKIEVSFASLLKQFEQSVAKGEKRYREVFYTPGAPPTLAGALAILQQMQKTMLGEDPDSVMSKMKKDLENRWPAFTQNNALEVMKFLEDSQYGLKKNTLLHIMKRAPYLAGYFTFLGSQAPKALAVWDKYDLWKQYMMSIGDVVNYNRILSNNIEQLGRYYRIIRSEFYQNEPYRPRDEKKLDSILEKMQQMAKRQKKIEERVKAEAEARKARDAERQARREAEAKAKAEAQARAKAEADARKAQAEARAKARAEAEAQAKAEAEAAAAAAAAAKAKKEKEAARDAARETEQPAMAERG